MHIDPNRLRILMVYIHVLGEHTLRVEDLDHLEHCMQLMKITNNILQKYECYIFTSRPDMRVGCKGRSSVNNKVNQQCEAR